MKCCLCCPPWLTDGCGARLFGGNAIRFRSMMASKSSSRALRIDCVKIERKSRNKNQMNYADREGSRLRRHRLFTRSDENGTIIILRDERFHSGPRKKTSMTVALVSLKIERSQRSDDGAIRNPG